MIRILPVTDYFQVNTYFIIDEKTNSGFLIDPGAQADLILKVINENSWNIKKILLTHGHFDHTGAVEKLQNTLNIPTYAHKNADTYLLNPMLNLSRLCTGDRIVRNTKKINTTRIPLNNSNILCTIIETPGHSQDSLSYYFPQENAVIVGDLFYQHGLGLTHFPGGDIKQLKKSTEVLLSTLPDETIIYSGHSTPITVFQQKQKLALDNHDCFNFK
ncbi:MBL fold metallo-hydrolase [Streptococcus gallolyticus subsp. gallolyticus]|uniref:MBL fold metallo-hydrolase n=1 Tax=Streptococcus gallolyticus TaxID=315405 RepID=UPI000882E825|nr:MBL fold metallo-hydrolase [Streptococcus gallolyticus]MCY7171201.1 MBL fold metallo-hydrolase [Streptococcus gallolyticus subsp. gallolyticus]SDK03255.1 Glyoxylase, beta-lactamase superfamily II [Streptococcus gallolyticus]SDL53134.1 Glyoxylase, beta-lactamase superfamily II [Streptococcus gallolyticus]